MGSQPFTVEDLYVTPEDGRRHELFGGVLIVTPVPDTRHQKIATRLAARLDPVCPDELHVLVAP